MSEHDNLFDLYDFVQEDLKFMVKSGIRLKILVSLSDGLKSMKEIKEEYDLSFATLSNNMKRLQEEGLVQKFDDKYKLSQMGVLKLDRIWDFHRYMYVANNFEDLWLNHNLKGIPDKFLNEIDVFMTAELVRSTAVDIYKPHNTYKDIVIGSTVIYGVSPISHPDFIELFDELIQSDTDIELILSDEIIKKTVISADFRDLSKAITNKNLNIRRYAGGNLDIAFTVTDKFISIGLFGSDGIYDQNRDLVSYDPRAVDWGMRLYREYYKKSEKLNVKTLAKILVS
ncbi:helix-turn-helix transcriptional regulator [Methanobacterium alcaliphilum]|uniref:helix-turn-helix transcriptional regulator n=1 Tax=Methanobacterium alcaliphilum TaxID=392018 RepID=UPI00200ACF02|nr:winged helix-turn-helix domain-containing protein [Methanobacterium alcaliphilum]MCK9151234.1 winged helix-turn-helix domain-containing protein [Methanobacterium alcaliphilum]